MSIHYFSSLYSVVCYHVENNHWVEAAVETTERKKIIINKWNIRSAWGKWGEIKKGNLMLTFSFQPLPYFAHHLFMCRWGFFFLMMIIKHFAFTIEISIIYALIIRGKGEMPLSNGSRHCKCKCNFTQFPFCHLYIFVHLMLTWNIIICIKLKHSYEILAIEVSF